MQNIIITADLAGKIQKGLAMPWRAITVQNITEDDVCLVQQDLRFGLVNPRVQRKRIADLDIEDIFVTRVGREIDDVIAFLNETGQTSNPETVVSLIDWERLLPASTPVVGCLRSSRPIEDSETADVMSHIALSKIITPLDEAVDGDVVAISLPFYHDKFSSFDDVAAEVDFFVVVKQQGKLVMQANSQCSADVLMRYQAWLDYGLSVNDWNTALGPAACNQLAPYLGKSFTATALFFTDCVIAVSTTDTKLLSVALPCLPDGEAPNQEAAIPAHVAQYLGNWGIWPDAPIDPGA